MLHEVGHLLGFLGWKNWSDIETVFEAGIEDGNFSGPLAGEVPVDSYGHLENGIMKPYVDDDGAEVTDTEIAILGDIGIPVDLA